MDDVMNGNGNKLPFEILRTIFLLSINFSDPNCRRGFHKYIIEPSQKKEPLSFTYVCSWWRAVALGIPELWTSLSGMRDWAGYTSVGVIRIWMEHASTRTIEVDMDEGGGRDGSSHKRRGLHLQLAPELSSASMESYSPKVRHTIHVLRLFWSHISQCRSLSLHLDKHIIQELYTLLSKLESERSTAPLLLLEDVELHFASRSSGVTAQIDAIIAWLRTLPSLRRLRWTYASQLAYSRPKSNLGNLPWNKLSVALISCCLTLEDTLLYLFQCTSATEVGIHNLELFSMRPAVLLALNLPIVTLANLVWLSLEGGGNPLILLDYLTLPALKYLSIKKLVHLSPVDYAAFEGFLERSECALDRLTIFDPKMPHNVFVSFILNPAVGKIKEVDVCYEEARTYKEDLMAVGEDWRRMAKLGLRKLMMWSWGPENHVGWKEKLRDKEQLDFRYESERV